jgi:hypothetical protein
LHFRERGEPVTYEVTIQHRVEDGHVSYTFAEIRLVRPAVAKDGVEGRGQLKAIGG